MSDMCTHLELSNCFYVASLCTLAKGRIIYGNSIYSKCLKIVRRKALTTKTKNALTKNRVSIFQHVCVAYNYCFG